jgi:hypothetical protein
MTRPSARAARVTRLVATAASRTCHGVTQLLGKAWQRHRALLLRNAAYAAATGAAAADIVNQVDLDRLVAAVLFAIAAIYMAIRYGQGAPVWQADGPTRR